jgi:hypothetical protein
MKNTIIISVLNEIIHRPRIIARTWSLPDVGENQVDLPSTIPVKTLPKPVHKHPTIIPFKRRQSNPLPRNTQSKRLQIRQNISQRLDTIHLPHNPTTPQVYHARILIHDINLTTHTFNAPLCSPFKCCCIFGRKFLSGSKSHTCIHRKREACRFNK